MSTSESVHAISPDSVGLGGSKTWSRFAVTRHRVSKAQAKTATEAATGSAAASKTGISRFVNRGYGSVREQARLRLKGHASSQATAANPSSSCAHREPLSPSPGQVELAASSSASDAAVRDFFSFLFAHMGSAHATRSSTAVPNQLGLLPFSGLSLAPKGQAKTQGLAQGSCTWTATLKAYTRPQNHPLCPAHAGPET
jgi:hypothetical protein